MASKLCHERNMGAWYKVLIYMVNLILHGVHVGCRRGGQTSDQKDFQGVEVHGASERIYDSIPDVIWHPQAPLHVTRPRTDLDPVDADKIQTTPNTVYGMQTSIEVEQGAHDSELSYCEAYYLLQQQKEKLPNSDNDHEDMSYCNAYLENRSFVNTV